VGAVETEGGVKGKVKKIPAHGKESSARLVLFEDEFLQGRGDLLKPTGRRV
jgi:hypothetical protein